MTLLTNVLTILKIKTDSKTKTDVLILTTIKTLYLTLTTNVLTKLNLSMDSKTKTDVPTR